ILNSFLGEFDIELMFKQSIVVLSVYLISFLSMKTYREIVRHTGLSEAIRIFKTVWLTCMILFLITLLVRSTTVKDSIWGEYLRLSYAVVFWHGFFTIVMLVAAIVVCMHSYD